ncbi:CLUMA_CG020634, isoform A [Clunio marinus]|uniref:CLUMA_CG020634, isoform A n=1 Tax=Clunio marinus TaxID=568069 RepID=A0A1J1J5I6_9DIPT|nr:CLUMA_CG020634, isoform A [Clunio marinus]
MLLNNNLESPNTQHYLSSHHAHTLLSLQDSSSATRNCHFSMNKSGNGMQIFTQIWKWKESVLVEFTCLPDKVASSHDFYDARVRVFMLVAGKEKHKNNEKIEISVGDKQISERRNRSFNKARNPELISLGYKMSKLKEHV